MARDAERYGVKPLDSSGQLFVYYDTDSAWTRLFLACITGLLVLGELIGLVCVTSALCLLHRTRSTISAARFRMHRQLLALLGFQVGRLLVELKKWVRFLFFHLVLIKAMGSLGTYTLCLCCSCSSWQSL